jgi:tetratricopeptide (TPR) repeat protein
MIAIERGDFRTAEDQLREALDIARARHHWMLDQVLANYGDLYVRTGRLPEALRALNESRQVLQAQYGGSALAGAEAWRIAILDSITGNYETERHDFVSAEKLLRPALDVLAGRFGEHSLYANQTAARLERLYTKWGRTAEALRYRMRPSLVTEK